MVIIGHRNDIDITLVINGITMHMNCVFLMINIQMDYIQEQYPLAVVMVLVSASFKIIKTWMMVETSQCGVSTIFFVPAGVRSRGCRRS